MGSGDAAAGGEDQGNGGSHRHASQPPRGTGH